MALVRQASGHIDCEVWVMSRFVQVDRETAYLLPHRMRCTWMTVPSQ